MSNICPKCSKEWPDEFTTCPVDQTPLIRKTQQTDGINLNLGDANAISGGISISDNRTVNNNTFNSTTNKIDSHNVINNITHIERNKSSEELLHEKKLAYRKACQDAFSYGVLSSDESKKLEEYRNTLGLDTETAKRIFTDVRSNSSRKYATLGPVQQIAFDKIKSAISQNQVDVVLRLFSELKAIAQSYSNEEVLFTYYMLQAILFPKDCIKAFETRTEDSYWQTFWVSIAYKKISKNGEAMSVSAELRDKWMDLMPAENEFILAATNNVVENELANAKICFANVEGMHSTELLELVASLYTILSPDFNCKDIFRSFYLSHLFSNKISLKDGSTKEGINIGKYFIGIVKNPGGRKREGKFLGNLLIDGIMWLIDGEKYEGEWKNGKLDGHGKVTYPNGRIYEGEWKNGKPDGHGKATYPDPCGGIYDGEWKDGKREGRGFFTFFDGTVYDGTWKNDEKEARGIMTFPDGRIFDGEFKKGYREGYGKLTYPDGRVIIGDIEYYYRIIKGKTQTIVKIKEVGWIQRKFKEASFLKVLQDFVWKLPFGCEKNKRKQKSPKKIGRQ